MNLASSSFKRSSADAPDSPIHKRLKPDLTRWQADLNAALDKISDDACWPMVMKTIEDTQSASRELYLFSMALVHINAELQLTNRKGEFIHALNLSQAQNIWKGSSQALLTDEVWETLRLSVPVNRAKLTKASAKKTFEEAFSDAYVHFSHYAKAKDVTAMCDRYAWANWLRGTAVFCQRSQQLTDRAHFIYFPDRGNVGPQTMSVDLNQDKLGQFVDSKIMGIQHAETLGIFSSGNRLPYIAAVPWYASTENEGITVGIK